MKITTVGSTPGIVKKGGLTRGTEVEHVGVRMGWSGTQGDSLGRGLMKVRTGRKPF